MPRWRNGHAIACRAIPIRFDSGPWLFLIIASVRVSFAISKVLSLLSSSILLLHSQHAVYYSCIASDKQKQRLHTTEEIGCIQRNSPHLQPQKDQNNIQQTLAVQVALYSASCLLYTSDAADDLLCVDLGGRRII